MWWNWISEKNQENIKLMLQIKKKKSKVGCYLDLYSQGEAIFKNQSKENPCEGMSLKDKMKDLLTIGVSAISVYVCLQLERCTSNWGEPWKLEIMNLESSSERNGWDH